MKQDRRNARTAIFLFHFLLFLYPVLSFAWRRHYPLISSEILAWTGLALLLSFLFSMVLERIRAPIANMVSALLLCLCFLVQFNLLLPALGVCLIVCGLLSWPLKRDFHRLGLIVLAALTIGAFIDSRSGNKQNGPAIESRSDSASLVPVVHVILDSAIGTAGLPDHEATPLIRQEINNFFGEFGFQVFPRAYSHYSQTGDSMYSAFNYQAEDVSRFNLEMARNGQHLLPVNAHLDIMNALGYRLNVYQTSHLDYCQSQLDSVNRCWNYEHPNVLSIRSAGSAKQRLLMLASVIANQSELLTHLLNRRGLLLNLGIAVHDPAIFDALEQDLGGEADGTYYLAHVLLPHGPFAYLNDCSVNYDLPIWARYANLQNEPQLPDWAYDLRNARYFEQTDCALNELRHLFNTMKSRGIFDRSIIVVHGDHGSMISQFQPEAVNAGRLTNADYRAGFSVMFAVKPPYGSFQENQQVASLPNLMLGLSELVAIASTGGASGPVTGIQLSAEKKRSGEFVYLFGEFPLRRVEVDLFGEDK